MPTFRIFFAYFAMFLIKETNVFSKQVNEYTSKQDRDVLLIIFYMRYLSRLLVYL